jgi:hypothetical protein
MMIAPRTYTATAKTRKRCPHCGKMVEAGTIAVFRTFVRETSWGFMPGGYIGARKHQITHAYHEGCAKVAPEMRQ